VSEGLERGLQSRHLVMLSVGGVIGAGYFLGAGAAVAEAGPAVVVAYALGGLVTVLVMALLAEMSVALPVAGSFGAYATSSFGPMAGFLTGWTYWMAFLIGPASETIAAATFLHAWFPNMPLWAGALGVAVGMTAVNLVGVVIFGEVEFWLSLVKVVALAVFIVWGGAAWAQGSVQGSAGSFAPHGVGGILAAMLIVIFGYGGTEAIGTAAEESAHPERDVPVALLGTVVRIALLYVASTAVLVAVLPWREAGLSSSPYVDAFRILGGPRVAGLMNFVVLTASLSCIDTGVYATSRMLFSLAREGWFPEAFARLHPRSRAPYNAIVASCVVLFAGAALFIAFPDFAWLWLANLSGFGFLFTWLMIALSHPGMRRRIDREERTHAWRVPYHPWPQRLAVAMMLAVLAAQAYSPSGRVALAAGAGWLLFAAAYWWLVASRRVEKLRQ
jgi:L-asparagine transporter-like permease